MSGLQLGRIGPVLVIGDVILDRDLSGDVTALVPDTTAPVVTLTQHLERPGGAALVAVAIARAGARVTLAAPLADDADGTLLRQLLPGVTLLPLADLARTRTLTRIRSDEHTLVRYDTPSSQLTDNSPIRHAALTAAMTGAAGILVSDYGGGTTAHPDVRRAIEHAVQLGRPVVWDPHPRGATPVPGITAVTPNRREIDVALAQAGQQSPTSLETAARELLAHWNPRALVATDGSRGALTVQADGECTFTTSPRQVPGDSCGAGDQFAANLVLALSRGELLNNGVTAAVHAVAAWLEDGGVSAESIPTIPPPTTSSNTSSKKSSIQAGNRSTKTVVATGGCFDVLHAGHVASLQAARQLGDRLVVLLNSDESVRRLKGPARPVHRVHDRRRVLESLACVDEVIVFNENTPAQALDKLRPGIWVKGADYAGTPMPEADLVSQWGGRVVLLPVLPGHSTTRILEHASTS